jgi:tetratricopeptide (TPR) repeat protein
MRRSQGVKKADKRESSMAMTVRFGRVARAGVFFIWLGLVMVTTSRLCAQEERPDMQKGIEATKKGDYATAIAAFTEAIHLNPGNAEAYRSRGVSYLFIGDNDKAIGDFNQSIEIDPDNEHTYLYRGSCYLTKLDYDAAIKDFSAAIQRNPNDASACIARGLVYYAKKDDEKATGDFSQALRLDPKSAEAYNDRGRAYEDRGIVDQAIADCSQAILLNPRYKEAYDIRGEAYASKGAYGKAIADYEMALQIDPKFVPAYNNLAWLKATCPLPGFRDGPKAVQIATKACDLTQWKNQAALETMAAACAETGDFDRAVKLQNQVLAMPGISAKTKDNGTKRLALYQAHQPFREKY